MANWEDEAKTIDDPPVGICAIDPFDGGFDGIDT
jgi:hypothetical protein